MNRLIPCPICKMGCVEIHEINGGLMVEVCRNCTRSYSRSRYDDKYDKYGRERGYDHYTGEILDEQKLYNKMYNPGPIKVAAPVDPKIAEREALLKILKETGLDKSVDG